MKKVLPHVGQRRLLKLAEFLRELSPKRFNFGRWVGSDWGGAQDLSCGTTACAVGWMPAIPFFRRVGVYFTKGEFGEAVVSLKKKGMSGRHVKVSFDSIDTAVQVFGLSVDQAEALFTHNANLYSKSGSAKLLSGLGSNASAARVAWQIEKFVDHWKAGKL